MAAQANANAIADLLQRAAANEATTAQLLQTTTQQGAQIQEQAAMLGTLEQEKAALEAQLAEATTTQAAQRARDAVPFMSEKMAAKLAPSKDVLVLSHEAFDILNRPAPDIIKVKGVVGKIIRLAGAALVGGEVSNQSRLGQPHEFAEAYYKHARPTALKTPEAADWVPDTILQTDNAALEKVKKAEKATHQQLSDREAQRRRLDHPRGTGNGSAAPRNFSGPGRPIFAAQQQMQQQSSGAGGGGANGGGVHRQGGGTPNFVPGSGSAQRR